MLVSGVGVSWTMTSCPTRSSPAGTWASENPITGDRLLDIKRKQEKLPSSCRGLSEPSDIRICICIRILVYIYICKCICTCICICVCHMYMYMHMHTYL